MSFTPDHAFDLISRSYEKGRLAHALLISGSEAAALQEIAVRIAGFVNNWKGVVTLDDLKARGATVISPEGKMRIIGVDDMRMAERALQFTSDNNLKICIIRDADRMQSAASNCFLKTLEEPPAHTLIMLLTRSPDQLLPTILSRCMRLPLFHSAVHGLTLSEYEEELVHLLAATFSAGPLGIGRATGLLGDFQALLTRIKETITEDHDHALNEEKSAYGKTTDGAWLKNREDHYDSLTESVYQDIRNDLLGLLFTWLGEILRRKTGLSAMDLPAWSTVTSAIAERFTIEDILRRLRAVDEMRRNLTTNVREPLALEVGFVKAFG